MTPSLIKTEYLSISITANTNVVRESNGSVSIELGSSYRISGNRREDFENLITAATKALELLPA